MSGSVDTDLCGEWSFSNRGHVQKTSFPRKFDFGRKTDYGLSGQQNDHSEWPFCLKTKLLWLLVMGPYAFRVARSGNQWAKSVAHPIKASNSLNSERGSRRPSFATLTCKATRATSKTSLVSE